MNGYGRGEDNQNKRGTSVVTRETFGMTLLFFSAILLVFSMIGPYILGDIGVAISAFLYGTLGFFVYPFFFLCIYGSLVLISGKKFISSIGILRILLLTLCVFLIAHLASSVRFTGEGFGAYLSGVWTAAETTAAQSTAGGIMLGLVVYPVWASLTLPGAYVIFTVLTLAAAIFFLWGTPVRNLFVHSRAQKEPKAEKPRKEEAERLVEREEKEEREPQRQIRQVQQAQPPRRYDASNQYPNYAEQSDLGNRRPPLDDGSQARRYQNDESDRWQNFGQMRPDPWQMSRNTELMQRRIEQVPPRKMESEPKQEKPLSGKDILFSNDPARNYWSNLAYNGDGYFNNRIRKSSVQPISGGDSWSSRTEQPSPTYSEGYHSQAEQPQQYVERQIIEQKPDLRDEGYTLRMDDLNYTRTPSYQEPKPVPPEERKEERKSELFEQKPADAFSVRREDDIERPRREELFSRDENRVEPRREELFSSDENRMEPRREELFSRDENRVEPRREELFNRDEDRMEPRREELFSRDENRVEPRREELFNRDENRVEPRREELFSRDENRMEPRREELFSRDENRMEPRREELFSRDENRVEPRCEDVFGESRRGEDIFSFDDRRTEERRVGFGSDEAFHSNEGRMDDRRMGMEPEHDFRADEPFSRGQREEPLFDARGTQGSEEEISAIPTLFPEKRELFRDEDVEAVRLETERPVEDPYMSEPENDYRDIGESRAMEGIGRSSELFDSDEVEPVQPNVISNSDMDEKPRPKEKHVYRPYVRPSLSVLRTYDDRISIPQEEIERNCAIIIDTLAGFRVDAEVTNVTSGPSVTRYDIDIPRNISLNTVTKRSGEIAMRLHARDGVNIYANNETGTISIEVPNSVRATVGLLSVMESEEYQSNKPGALMFAIGKDIEGRNVCGNIAKMKHLLVAGATGSGKSVCLNTMLISLICKYSPEDLRLILIDPKKVEFTVYDKLPHLMINEIISDAQKAIMALNWAVKEMDRRYELFRQKTSMGIVVRELDEYNKCLTEDEEKLPKIVFVVDELADLMSVDKKNIEERIQRLTQLARAAGIHMVIATQRPSVDVITGVIKGNLPTRIAFRVIQDVDSRTILDEGGAEKLLGNGDMLYKSEGMFNCARVQGAFLSSEEVQMIVNDIKQNNESYFDQEVSDFINKPEMVSDDDYDGKSRGTSSNKNDDDPLYVKSLAIVVKLGSASISLIQRKCAVGYNHAGKILEWMEEKGYVSPFDGKAKARTVLLTKEEFESQYGPLDSF